MKSVNWKKVAMIVAGLVIAVLVVFCVLVAYVWYSYESSPEVQFYREIRNDE